MIKIKSFSLIELIVVISVVALLSSIAAPVYSRYIALANINRVIAHMKTSFIDKLIEHHSQGRDTNWLTEINGLIVNLNNFANYDFDGVISAAAIAATDANSDGKPAAFVNVSMTDAAANAFDTFTPINIGVDNGINNVITMLVVYDSDTNIYAVKCGVARTDSTRFADIDYLPSTCNTPDLKATYFD